MAAHTGTRRTAEPFVWLLFSSGGVAAALVLPVLLVVFGVAVPLGLIHAPHYDHLRALVGNPLTRLVIFGVCALSLVHAAHRLRFTLRDGLQLQRFDRAVEVLCYGGALAGWAFAVIQLTPLGHG
jgi:fumarate reductase subunit D